MINVRNIQCGMRVSFEACSVGSHPAGSGQVVRFDGRYTTVRSEEGQLISFRATPMRLDGQPILFEREVSLRLETD